MQVIRDQSTLFNIKHEDVLSPTVGLLSEHISIRIGRNSRVALYLTKLVQRRTNTPSCASEDRMFHLSLRLVVDGEFAPSTTLRDGCEDSSPHLIIHCTRSPETKARPNFSTTVGGGAGLGRALARALRL